MEKPIISYSAKISSNSTFQEDIEEIYGGTYTNENPIEIDIRIWNNKYGIEDVEDLEDFDISLKFESLEDKSLIDYIYLSHKNVADLSMNTLGDERIGAFVSSVILSGAKNNGLESDKNNYVDLKLTFNIGDKSISLKNQDLKSLYLKINKK